MAVIHHSYQEEKINTITHGAGLIASLFGIYYLLESARIHTDVNVLVGCTIYAISLVVLYFSSMIYHGIEHPQLKKLFRIIDHSAIFIFIAATYTPFALTVLKGSFADNYLIAIWVMAIVGIFLKVQSIKKYEHFTMLLYLGMGWFSLMGIEVLLTRLSMDAIVLLIGGGIFYTFGIYFYMNHKIPYHHAIWHIFVMAGSFSHYIAIYQTVV